MGFFNKKDIPEKTSAQLVFTDYTQWSQDLGFLELLMTRQKNLAKNFDLNMYSDQLGSEEYIKDKEIKDIIVDSVNRVVEAMSENYINYLVSKYFKDKEKLIEYISEDISSGIRGIALELNNRKIKNLRRGKSIQKIVNTNFDISENDEEETIEKGAPKNEKETEK